MSTEPPIVEVFGVGPDGALVPATQSELRQWSTAEVAGALRSSVEVRAKAGHRPGGYADRADSPVGHGSTVARRGSVEDVVAPVYVAPATASRILHSGEPFDTPVPGLNVDLASLAVGDQGSSWKATVRYGRFGRTRQARLRAYPSPSANLTVLELVPTRQSIVMTTAFVRIGVPAIATLGSRILASAKHGNPILADRTR